MIQRWAYRRTMRQAHTMLFLSEYLRRAYRENAGFFERSSAVVYAGLDEDTRVAAAEARATIERQPYQLLSVSAMARHKGMEVAVRALHELRVTHGLPARLVVAGSWPDLAYQRQVRRLVGTLGLDAAVDFLGHVPRATLYKLYAGSQAFVLMSRCESFGIPAIEAQAFGTPVVGSNCCAIPEVCGEGGVFPPADDSGQTAQVLLRLLMEPSRWLSLSERARRNADRFRWEDCSRSLLHALDRAATDEGS